MSTIVTLIALLIALSSVTSKSGGINPVQHSERAAAQASKGINPVQHSE